MLSRFVPWALVPYRFNIRHYDGAVVRTGGTTETKTFVETKVNIQLAGVAGVPWCGEAWTLPEGVCPLFGLFGIRSGERSFTGVDRTLAGVGGVPRTPCIGRVHWTSGISGTLSSIDSVHWTPAGVVRTCASI